MYENYDMHWKSIKWKKEASWHNVNSQIRCQMYHSNTKRKSQDLQFYIKMYNVVISVTKVKTKRMISVWNKQLIDHHLHNRSTDWQSRKIYCRFINNVCVSTMRKAEVKKKLQCKLSILTTVSQTHWLIIMIIIKKMLTKMSTLVPMIMICVHTNIMVRVQY